MKWIRAFWNGRELWIGYRDYHRFGRIQYWGRMYEAVPFENGKYNRQRRQKFPELAEAKKYLEGLEPN